jgi:exosortase
MTASGPLDRQTLVATPRSVRLAMTPTRTPLLMVLALLAVLLAFSGTITALVQQWWTYQNHGLVLVALVGWVCWRDRFLLLANPTPWWPATALMAGSSLAWFLGVSAGIQVIEQIAMLGVLGGWAIATLGYSSWRRVLRLVGYLALAMPAWGLLIGVLQQLTVMANALLLSLSGLEATITGTYIAIPEGTFEVAGSCAGQAFLMSGLTVAVAYWEISSLNARGRWLALALMAALSLVSNWLRVFLLILIGHFTAMKSPLIADHGWFGWVLFAIMVSIFFAATRHIELRYGAKPAATATTPADTMAAQPPMIPVVGLSALAMIGPLGVKAVDQLPRATSPAEIRELAVTSAWQQLARSQRQPLAYGDTASIRPWAPRYAGADRHEVQYWVRGADTVQVDRLIFSGRDHRHKLFADGNAMDKRQAVLLDKVVGVSVGNTVRSFRQAAVRVDSAENRVILYWFVVGGRSTGVPMVGRLHQSFAFLARSAPAELVAVSAACLQNCETAFEPLQDFVLGDRAVSTARQRP